MQRLKGHTEYVYLHILGEALNGESLDFLRQFFGSDRQKNRDGFSNRTPSEALGRRCGFAGRFSL